MEFGVVAALIISLVVLPWIRRQFLKSHATIIPANAREAVVLARVRQLKNFYIHASMYVITMVGIGLLAIITKNSQAVLVLGIGWALAVSLHGFWVFGINGIMHDWERRQVKTRLEHDNTDK